MGKWCGKTRRILLNDTQGSMYKNDLNEHRLGMRHKEQSDIKGFLEFRGLKAEMDQHHHADAREETVC